MDLHILLQNTLVQTADELKTPVIENQVPAVPFLQVPQQVRQSVVG